MTKEQLKHMTMVRALMKPGDSILASLTAHRVAAAHAALGIAGEAGEVVDEIKKCVFNNRDFDLVKIIIELGDLEFYLEALRQELNITREDCLQANIDKLSIRYENWVYSDRASVERKDTDSYGMDEGIS